MIEEFKVDPAIQKRFMVGEGRSGSFTSQKILFQQHRSKAEAHAEQIRPAPSPLAAVPDETGTWQGSRWGAGELGDHIGLTFEEKIRLDIRTIRCCDRTKQEVAAYYRKRKRERDRERRRAQREKRRMEQSMETAASLRAKALMQLIKPDECASLEVLDARTARLAMFRSLSPASRLNALRRAVNLLPSKAVSTSSAFAAGPARPRFQSNCGREQASKQANRVASPKNAHFIDTSDASRSQKRRVASSSSYDAATRADRRSAFDVRFAPRTVLGRTDAEMLG